jgi:hypothetical protein
MSVSANACPRNQFYISVSGPLSLSGFFAVVDNGNLVTLT